jgi:hypothetical protein
MIVRHRLAGTSRLFIAFCLAVLSVVTLRAQVSNGSIQGSVSDQTGAYVENAAIVAKNIATGITTRSTSNSRGFFTVSDLLPGSYTVSVSASTFSSTVVSNIVLTVGAQQTLNVSLVPGKVTEVVQVTTGAPAVDLATSTLGDVVNRRTVVGLPLNTRDWTQLATLQPGVSAVHTQVSLSSGPNRGNRGFGSQLTISGQRPNQNNYLLDGISINDYSNGGPGSVLGVNLGVDAVEEFSVLTSNYSAQYGRTSGGVISAITKSGTNMFHGDAYEFYRNSAMDARNYFDPVQKAPFLKNQYGASAGGPIIKNKMFIFGDYEGVSENLTATAPITVPSDAARAGNFTTGTVTVDPVAAKFLGLYPHADPGTVVGDVGKTTSLSKIVTAENYFTIRLDDALAKNDSLAATYVFDRGHQLQPDILNSLLSGNKTNRQIATLTETHTFSVSLLNSLRLGYNADSAYAGLNASAINPLANDTSLAVVPGLTAPGLKFADNSAAQFGGGLGGVSNYIFDYTSLQLYDDVFLTKGVNSIKFGVAFEQLLDDITLSSDSTGQLTYSTFSNFLKNGPIQAFDAPLPGNTPEFYVRQRIMAGYVQDDVRARKNLTLNLGMRYEIATVPTEANGKLSVLVNMTDPTPHLGSPYFNNPTFHNVEPRVGFSWDPSGDGKMAIRGGVGLFDVLPLPYLYEVLIPLSAPYSKIGTASNLSAGLFPGGIYGTISGGTALRQTYLTHSPKRNYVTEWNLNVQRSLTSNVALTIAYAGSRGIHQAFRSDEINSVVPADTTSLTPLFPGLNSSGKPIGTVLNPNVGEISAVLWTGDSYFDALEAHLVMRATHGLSGGISYTYGKSLDTGSSTVAGNSFSNSLSTLPFYNARLRRGPSDYDQKHNLVANYLWNIPSPNTSNSALEWLAGGWQLSGEYQISTGIPFTATLSGDPLGESGHSPLEVPDRVTGSGCNSLVNSGSNTAYINIACLAAPNPLNRRGNLSRNALYGPRLQDLDVAFIKNNPIKKISDGFNTQLRLEFYNIANHANFAPPLDHAAVFGKTGAPIPFAGLIDTTTTTSRQVQLGLKVIW